MSNQHYPEINPSPDFAKLEEQILDFWAKENVFEASIAKNKALTEDGKKNEYIFYDGPPFANGLPHYGHLLTGFVKDIFARYQTMRGKRVERKFGWDCHGLPAEMGAEKELGISGRQAILGYGIEKFNNQCRTSVMKYTSEWESYVNRQARWVDFKNDYKTMDFSFMESVLWAFKQLWDKGYIYEAYRVMPYSWAAETPLSNFETKLDNSYRERIDPAVTVAFELLEIPDFISSTRPEIKSCKILAWTTTPWTLPSNLALAVSPDIDYAVIVKDGVGYITGSFASLKFLKELGFEGEIDAAQKAASDSRAIFSGTKLVGLSYKPLFPYFSNHPNSFKILSADFIEEGEGTGVVHMAPGFGEEDQKTCEENGIKVVVPVDIAGKFTSEIYDLNAGEFTLSVVGKNVFEANKDIIKYLTISDSVIKREDYRHNYPHCWRTDEPLIYRALPSWYVAVTKFKDRMVELNQQINWVPSHIRDGLFNNMLKTAPDWSISRNRFWGAPIPIWRSDNPNNKKLYCFGSVAELEAFFGQKVTDLHRPYIDELIAPDPEDSKYTLRRVEDVLDCWFESGSMPYAQVGYPKTKKEWLENHLPADFIVEYHAQTRGWFYTLMVLSTALFDKPPFLNCIAHGVVLDDKGQKLSKRLNNYADPKDIFNKFGADALRWLMVSSPVMSGNELYIDKEGKFIRDVVRLYIKPLWNAYNFFTIYANSDKVKANLLYTEINETINGKHSKSEAWRVPDNTIDRYILSKLSDAIENAKDGYDNYNTQKVCKAIEDFLEALNNWYIRRSRDRFWKTEKDSDKQDAYDTLYTCLVLICKIAAPILPLVTEEIYINLTASGEKKASNSVHIADFPVFTRAQQIKNPELVAGMDFVRDICTAALSIRSTNNIRVRQPLEKIYLLYPHSENRLRNEFQELIKDETNVKNIAEDGSIDNFARKILKVNFPVLGKTRGKETVNIKRIVTEYNAFENDSLRPSVEEDEKNGYIRIYNEKFDYTLTTEECEMSYEPNNKSTSQFLKQYNCLVVLNTNISAELEQEGIARDVVRMIQQARKDAALNVSDRIKLSIHSNYNIKAAIKNHEQYILEQTLGVEMHEGKTLSHSFENTLEDEKIVISLEKI